MKIHPLLPALGGRAFHTMTEEPQIELSLIIPVYNAGESLTRVVEEAHEVLTGVSFEMVLVNDGSVDDTEQVCSSLAGRFSRTTVFVQLAHNFGEHNAVLAGLNLARGEYMAVLDDDGQHPPSEVLRLLKEIKTRNFDVVYGHYVIKQHSRFRNLGSWFNDRMATLMLKKPRELYLSSFKVMNRFTVNEVIKYRGPFPYIDGLIYRTTRNLGQIPVEHRPTSASSRYNLQRLLRLWFNMFLGFSIVPLRVCTWLGLGTSVFSVFLLIAIIIDKLYITRVLTLGVPTVLATVTLFAGIQLVILGLIGEYLGRLFLDLTGTPQFVVRYVRNKNRTD